MIKVFIINVYIIEKVKKDKQYLFCKKVMVLQWLPCTTVRTSYG